MDMAEFVIFTLYSVQFLKKSQEGRIQRLDGFVVCIAQQADLVVKDIALMFHQKSGKRLIHNVCICNVFE